MPDHTTETTQLEPLLAAIDDLTDTVVTGDAAHTQHATAAHLTGRGGYYCLQLKANQPHLLAAACDLLPPAAPGSADHQAEDRSRGRVVTRQIWTAPVEGIDFPAAAQAFRIRRDRFAHTGERLSKEVVHGLSSLTPEQASPAQLADLVQRHWSIEKASHRQRDVTYREDHQHAYAGTGAHLLAIARNLCLRTLRLAGTTQITRTLQRNVADRTRILPLINAATSTNRL